MRRFLRICLAILSLLVLGIILLLVDNHYRVQNYLWMRSTGQLDEEDLMHGIVWNVAHKQASDLGITLIAEEHSGVFPKSKIRPFFVIDKKLELNAARKYAFEIVLEYRKRMARDEGIIHFYKSRKPEYDLEKKFFPLERTAVDMDFGQDLGVYKEPFIAEVSFAEGVFHYLVLKPSSKKHKEIFHETYEEAEAFHNSQTEHVSGT
jgi:hypothetical protein